MPDGGDVLQQRPAEGAPAERRASGHVDPLLKRLARAAWRRALGLSVLLAARDGAASAARVFYGGARSGDAGGPLVKVKRLREHFPEHRLGYNTVYVLSNAPYLSAPALERLKRKGIGIVHNQNGVFYPAWYAGDWQRENARMAASYRLADHVFWQTDFCRRAAERFLGSRKGPGEVLYNAVDTHRFTPAAASPREGRLTFLVTGKIGPHLAYRLTNTVEGLAAAVRLGLDARLTIAGLIAQEAQAAALEAAEACGIAGRVRLAGPFSQAEAPDLYRSAHAYIMTKYMDPCPNVVIEALACGLPVVYSASGGVPELVGEDAGVGIEVPEDWERVHTPDPEALGRAMIEVAERLPAMSAAARARAVERFGIAHWIVRHRAVFHQLLMARQ
jgi:glycosyltransferase involved in cell wall biosynthesis